jgi:hypothetical protein
MKNKVARTLPMLMAVLVVALAPTQANASSCSLANTAGDWAYSYTGTIFTQDGPLPAAAVGHFHGDAAGNISGSQTRSVAGDTAVEDISGTVLVNSNCTFTATVNVLVDGQVQRTAVLAGAYDNNRKHARDIFQSLTLSDGTNVPVVITMDASRVSVGKD